MAEVNWTGEAERWLKDIHDYIAKDSPESAVRVVEAIYQNLDVFLKWGGGMLGLPDAKFVFCYMGTTELHT